MEIKHPEYIEALLARAEHGATYDSKRRAETLACSFIRDNLRHAFGLEPMDPELVMDEEGLAYSFGLTRE